MKKNNFISKWLVLAIYVLVSWGLYPHLWKQLIRDDSKRGAVHAEVVAASWGMEEIYQNILEGKNPFSYRIGQLYPFGNSLVSNDAGNGFFFVLLRPIFSIYQSLSLITALSLVMGAWGMYLLLSKLKVKREIAIVMGAVFGYTTLFHPRMGHMTYLTTYMFPWFYYFILRTRENVGWRGMISAAMAGLMVTLSLYHNLTYFVVLVWMNLAILSYALIKERTWLWNELRLHWHHLLVMGGVILITMSPWLIMLSRVKRFEGLPVGEGWGGAIKFSADIFGIFIPSTYSWAFGNIVERLSLKLPFIRGIFEQYNYPGIILLLGMSLIGLNWKRIKASYKRSLRLVICGATFFWIMTLGPFLTILGIWKVNLDGVYVMIPLPFALIHYLPFMENIRSPGRLAIGMVFFATIAVALYLNQIKGKKQNYRLLILGLIILFVIDHPFHDTPAKDKVIPEIIYQTIKQDEEDFSVYEMPSTVRDGFHYFGNMDGLSFIDGQLIHGKPVLAGYFGRVTPAKREYFSNNPFLGFMGRLMDEGVENNGSIDRTELPKWREIDLEKSRIALDLLATKYVILKDEQFYSASASAVLSKLEFNQISNDRGSSLWERKLTDNEYKEAAIGQIGDDAYLGVGWRGRDKNFRYMGKTGSIFFRVNRTRPMILEIIGAAYYQAQTAQVYLNQELVGEINFGTEIETYKLNLTLVPRGLITVQIVFPFAYQPLAVEPGNLDKSMLSAKMMKVSLKERND